MSGIKLSAKHGVNPSLEVCFWCGKDVGVALLGKLKGDAEAPKRIVLGLQPCDDCKRKFAEGIRIVEVSEDGSMYGDNPAFAIKAAGGMTVYPTGRWALMPPEAIKDGKAGSTRLADKETMEAILANGKKG